MKAKLAFVAGLGVGYVVGTRVGRSGYENLKESARSLWQADAVQETVQQLEDSLTDQAKNLGTRLVGKVTANDSAAAGTRSTPPAQIGLPDVESDPALNDGAGRDWADEGGALPTGPAK